MIRTSIVARCTLALLTLAVSQLGAQRGGRGGGGGSIVVQPPRFSYLGPDNGGRIASVAGVPGDTSTYYFGAASGGIWKTTDGARTFAPIFDDQSVQAIGALATAPSNPRIVWAGTGEAWAIRDADVMGDGIYKSSDAGATWQNMGLKETGRIGKIVIHPSNPNIVYVCALGRATGPQEERGVYRTLDGGATWSRVLFVNPNTGCSGLSIDASDPKTLFAGTWEVVMHTWAMFSGGQGSGVYVSHDSGSTWNRITDPGLPHSPIGKIDVAVAPSNSSRVYALMQTPDQGSLWRSDDGGVKWKVVSWDRSLIGRAGYYIKLMINPENDLEVLIANSSFHRSLNGGETFPFGGSCGDCHDVWVDPRNPAHWALTDDGGASITRDHGQSYSRFSLPVAQMYHVAIDDRTPYWVYGNRQDDGTMRGANTSPVPVTNVPSYSGGGRGGRGGGGAAASTWQAGLGGCESGFTLPTPGNPDIVWATCYGNKVTRYDDKVGLARSVAPGNHTLDSPPDKAKYRCHWTPPLAIDPFDPGTVYYGCQVIFKTSNAGQSWKVISPDLSTNDPTRIVSSGGIVGDNLGQFYGEVVFAIAPSEIQKGLIWAGTNDGKIWNTTDGGAKWNDVTKNVSGLAPWGTIRKIEPSRFDARTAYVVVDYHMMDDRKPYIYKTSDLGKTWQRISDALPQDHPLAYAMSLAENPNRRGMLFVGTGNALYYSLDDGAKWTLFRPGLPASPVSWITIAKREHDVVVSTYGRGIYVMHDITMLEQSDQARFIVEAPVKIYQPREGMRMPRSGSAELLLVLAAAPKDSLKVDILDSAGTTIRSMTTMGRAGTNRITWDLRYDPPREPELRTTPPDNPHIWDEPRFKDKVTRPILHWGIEGTKRAGPLAAPGKYTFRITVDSTAYSQAVAVAKDPRIASSTADLQLSTSTQRRVRDDLNATTDIVNTLEIVRKQVEDYLKVESLPVSVAGPLKDLNKKALEVELLLLTRADLHSDDKWFTEQYKVYLNLVWLNGAIGTGAGDVAGGADYRPTDAAMEELAGLEKELAAAKAAFADFMAKDLAAYNASSAGQSHPVSAKLPTTPTSSRILP